MATLALYCTEEQARVAACDAQHISMMAGRRFGKTFAFRNRALSRVARRPGMQYWYIAPSYAQCKEQYDSLASHPALSDFVSSAPKQPYPAIRFRNGSSIAFRTWDRPRNLRGSGLAEVWFDEIQDVPDGDEFWAVIRPLLSDQRGTLVISGQFRGLNWYYESLVRPGLEGRDGYAAFVFPSELGMVYRSPAGQAELARVREQIPAAVYDQEYACVPTANQAAVFRPDDLAACAGGELAARAAPGRRYVAAVDLGRVADPLAFVALDVSSEPVQVVASEELPLGTRHEVASRAMARRVRDYGSPVCVVDVTGGATGGHAQSDSYTRYYRDVIPSMREYHWTPAAKQRLVHDLALAVEQHRLRVPAAAEALLRQLGAYEFARRRSGVYEYGAPKGQHDDHVAALMMAWQAYLRGWAGSTSGAPVGGLVG
jgi:hypothetical protein